MSADFMPEYTPANELKPFRFWCQKVLPLVFDDTLSYYELLCKVVDYLNKAMTDVNTLSGDIDGLMKAYEQLQDYVNHYFDNLDLQTEIDTKLDEMVTDGTLAEIVAAFVYPTPLYADNTSGMTNHDALYVNGENGHLYRWNGSAWTDTGITYSAGMTQLLGVARALEGKILLEYDAETGYSFTWDATNPKIMLKDGSAITPENGVFTVSSSGLHYIFWNQLSSSYEVIYYTQINKGSQPNMSAMFAVYSGRIIPLGIPIVAKINTYPPYRKTNFVGFVIPFDYSYSANLLTVNHGRFILSTGQVTSDIPGTSYTNNYTDTIAYFVYNHHDKIFEIIPYNAPGILSGCYDIIGSIYNGRMTLNFMTPEDSPSYKRIMCGPFFVSMRSGGFHVETGLDAHVLIDGVSILLQNVSVDVPIPSMVANYYLCVNSGGFYAKRYTEINGNDLVIAYWYFQELFTDHPDHVAINTIKVTGICQYAGQRYNINYDRLGYKLYPYQAKNNNNIRNFGSFLQFVNGYNAGTPSVTYKIGSSWYNDQNNFITVRNLTELGGKKVMMIGDSISQRGWLQAHITAQFSTIEFVGTIETGTPTGQTGYYCEAIPGASIDDFFRTDSNFYNPTTESFDFSYYVSNQNIVPDYVTIQFGLNEGTRTGTEFAEYMQQMIDSIHDYSADIKVYVITPFRRRIGAHDNTYATNYNFFKFDKWRTMCCYGLTGCTIIPAWYLFNDDLDYVYSDLSANYGSLTVKGCSDNIHPAQATGFLMLANMIMGYLGL